MVLHRPVKDGQSPIQARAWRIEYRPNYIDRNQVLPPPRCNNSGNRLIPRLLNHQGASVLFYWPWQRLDIPSIHPFILYQTTKVHRLGIHIKRYKHTAYTQTEMKCLFRPQNGSFGELWTPKCNYSSSRPPKGTSLRKSASFKLSTVKIRWRVWPVGELTESVTDTHTHTHTGKFIYKNSMDIIMTTTTVSCCSSVNGKTRIDVTHNSQRMNERSARPSVTTMTH